MACTDCFTQQVRLSPAKSGAIKRLNQTIALLPRIFACFCDFRGCGHHPRHESERRSNQQLCKERARIYSLRERTITTPNDPIVLWATAHPRQRSSSRWTKGQSCTNFQIGPLKWGHSGRSLHLRKWAPPERTQCGNSSARGILKRAGRPNRSMLVIIATRLPRFARLF